jgi:hypothetical protein
MEAALIGSKEIGFTIISMTISLAAVFIPVLFMGGIVGRLLHFSRADAQEMVPGDLNVLAAEVARSRPYADV